MALRKVTLRDRWLVSDRHNNNATFLVPGHTLKPSESKFVTMSAMSDSYGEDWKTAKDRVSENSQENSAKTPISTHSPFR